MDPERIDRRTLLGRAAALSASASLIGATGAAARRPRRRKAVPLPSPQRVRDDFTRMVEFGPRLTASPSHQNYIAWLEQEFEAAGLRLLPCDGYTTDRWLAEGF